MRGPRCILAGVDLEVSSGMLVGVVGPNGAGKSTLLECLAGDLEPAAGTVELEGHPLAAFGARARARAMALVPQAMLPAFPVTVEHFVGLGRYAHEHPLRGPSSLDRGVVQRCLAELGLLALAQRPVDRLSGGEFRRVLICQAMVQEAPLLLFDEPVQQLDLRHQLEVMEFVRAWTRRSGTAGLVVLHELGLAARYCDELVLLGQGRMLARGTPEEVLTAPHVRAAYGVDCRIERCPVTNAIQVVPIAPL
jgi:iron complex transport system ATP-binding protein